MIDVISPPALPFLRVYVKNSYVCCEKLRMRVMKNSYVL